MATSFFDDDDRQCDVVPLIVCDNDKYTVDPDTAAWLTEHRKPFAVIACAGKYRTGKSFLLNRLANAPSGTGFGVGNTVQACTKGLWVYKKWFSTSDPDKDMLFVDTEGIDALDADDTHDVRIFTLALLLSSCFLYNSVGALDETSMQTLSLMTRVTQNVRVHSETEEANSANLAQHMPMFRWVLRDFALDLRDRSGKAISPNQYLEEALQGTDKSKEGVRGAIRDAFKERELITLPRPSTDDNNANRLEDRLFSVSPKFTKVVDALRERLFTETPPFASQGKAISGRMYVTLCKHLAHVVQTNAVPVMKDSWSLMAAVQARDLKDAVLADFEDAIGRLEKTPAKQLEKTLEQMRNDALGRFDREAVVPIDADIRSALDQRLVVLSANAFEYLARHLVEDATVTVDDIETQLFHSPTNAAVCIAEAEARFFDKFGQDDESKIAWRTVIGERLTRWFPRIAEALESKREQIQLNLDAANERHAALQREILSIQESAADDFKLEMTEKNQLIDSQTSELASLRLDNERLTNELVMMESALRKCEAELERVRVVCSGDGDDEHEMAAESAVQAEDDETIVAMRMDMERLRTELQQTQAQVKVQRKQCSEYEERLRTLTEAHKRVEESWHTGLQELRNSESAARQSFEARLKDEQAQIESCENKIKEERRQNELSKERIRGLVASAEQHNQIHESEKQQLRDAAQKNREQCEAAQQRVIEIHKSMLDDLRARDERAREQQSGYLKERAEMSARVTELVAENTQVKENLGAAKRRINEFDAMERESKRLKQQHQHDSLIINRLEAENEQLKLSSTTITDEKERLRQENLSMEGELAVLRAEKQLNDARRTIADAR